MAKEFKVVIGANYGDEGKGLTSGALALDAANKGNKILTCFYNGTTQRLHSYGDHLFRSIGPGNLFGGETYYTSAFVVDPITLYISQSKPIISPYCRVILPCDVARNHTVEKARGKKRYGSCGFGLFECVKRNKEEPLHIFELKYSSFITALLEQIDPLNLEADDEVYNLHNFLIACEWMLKNCRIAKFHEIVDEFDTIIFEGGQGLLLDQSNRDGFPYLTPSSTGSTNIIDIIDQYSETAPEIYYVSRTYMTRHGAGALENECKKEDINPDIVDNVNQPNEWQGQLRFGFLNEQALYARIQDDLKQYKGYVSPRIVFTQMNYTNGELITKNGEFSVIEKPDFIDEIYGSWNKTNITQIL